MRAFFVAQSMQWNKFESLKSNIECPTFECTNRECPNLNVRILNVRWFDTATFFQISRCCTACSGITKITFCSAPNSPWSSNLRSDYFRPYFKRGDQHFCGVHEAKCRVEKENLWSPWNSAELFPGRVDPRVGAGWVGSGILTKTAGRVGSRPWRVGSGPSTLTRPDPPCFSKPVNVNFDSDTHWISCKLFPIIQRNLHHSWNW